MFSTPLPAASAEGFDDLLIAAAMFVVGRALPRPHSLQMPVDLRKSLRVGGAGIALIAVPVLLLHAAEGFVPATLTVVLFALMPVLLIPLTSVFPGEGAGLQVLGPSLAGVAGLLLLLPLQIPSSAHGFLGAGLVLVAVASVAAAWVLLGPLSGEMTFPQAAVWVVLPSGILLSLVGLASGSGSWSWHAVALQAIRTVLFEAPEILLLLWLLRVLSPARLAARYLVAPLFTVLQGFAVVRPLLDLRTVVGVVLLAFGAYRLFADISEPREQALKLT